MTRKKPTFEEALAQLDSLAQQIEQGAIGLEESITKYQEGMGLIKHCRGILARAEQKIMQLQTDADGEMKAVPFDPQGGSGAQRNTETDSAD